LTIVAVDIVLRALSLDLCLGFIEGWLIKGHTLDSNSSRFVFALSYIKLNNTEREAAVFTNVQTVIQAIVVKNMTL